MDIIPIFKSHYSIGRSIIILEDEDIIKENTPVSLFAISKVHKLQKLYLADSSFSGFIQFYKNCEKRNIQGIFGLNLTVCNDATQKTEESLKTESVVTIWMKNSDGYRDLLKIHNKAATENFYYIPRTDTTILRQQWTENLLLTIDYYNGFLACNLLENHNCTPDFGFTEPIITMMDGELPFDGLLGDAYLKFAVENKLEVKNVHNIYYYNKSDFRAYLTFRCINKRSVFTKPNLNCMSSDNFCWERYLELAK